MPLPVAAPYDTLATVTALVRTILADYIQNIQPNNAGVVGVNGVAVTWVSGNQFTALFNGVEIIINGQAYTVAMVTSPTTLTLVQAAGVQANVAYSLVIPTGDIFADSQAYVVPTVNLAWRKLQLKLDYGSHSRMKNEADIFSLPVAGSSDPATQQWINWTNFFDGANLWSPAAPPPSGPCPVLPSDFLAPMRLYERQSVGAGQVNPNGFRPMHPATDGLPSAVKSTYNKLWDWREDALYFIGSMVNLDLRVIYQAFLADIAAPAGGFGSTIVPVMRSGPALAYYSAAIFVAARGSLLAPGFEATGDQLADALTNRQAKVLQRGSYRRRAVYDSSGRYRNNGLH